MQGRTARRGHVGWYCPTKGCLPEFPRILSVAEQIEAALAPLLNERDSLKARIVELEREAMETAAEQLRAGEVLAAAVAAEREACTKEAVAWLKRNGFGGLARAGLMTAIRARGGR